MTKQKTAGAEVKKPTKWKNPTIICYPKRITGYCSLIKAAFNELDGFNIDLH